MRDESAKQNRMVASMAAMAAISVRESNDISRLASRSKWLNLILDF